MKNDRGVKSDVGNVEMPCLFSPFFASLSSGQHRGFWVGGQNAEGGEGDLP